MKSIIAALMMFPLAAFSQSLSLPIECGSDKDLEIMLNEFKEVPAFSMETNRVGSVSRSNLSIKTTFYINFETKTWTLIEHFPEDKLHCIISSGENITPAVSLYKEKEA
jgi:hypothetical protein